MRNNFLERTHKGLIVSCQALKGEPLHSSYIMSRMALATKEGGACGIRANTPSDITEIRKVVDLPIIGIIKQDYPDCHVYITPTVKEVDALMNTGVDVIAIDATQRKRPHNQTLDEIFRTIRSKYPDQLFMADCSCYEDAVIAKQLGFDIISTTLCGYTQETKELPIPNFPLIYKLCSLSMPVIVEGGIWLPDTLGRIIAIPGVHAAVVGSAITRPLEITKRFVSAIHGGSDNENSCY